MEMLAALGVAGNVMQFLDFGQKLCNNFFEIYNTAKGITKANADTQKRLETFIDSADIVIVDLKTYIGALSSGGGDGAHLIQSTLDKCLSLANDLMARIQALKVPSGAGRWKAALAVVKSMWKEKELMSIQSNLGAYRKELEWLVLLSLRSSMSLFESRQKDQFGELQSAVISKLTEEIKSQFRQLPKLERISMPQPQIGSPKDGSTDNTAAMAKSLALKLADADHKVLESLDYTVMRDRESSISDAEAETFDWIFKNPEAVETPWSNFREWLSGDSAPRLYWVNGKAGSGKSTLMKHLFRHKETRKALAIWADQSKLLMAGFFFWYSGSQLQRSQEGLLRALLFACLSEHRELIPVAFPDLPRSDTDISSEYWSMGRLEAATKRLVSQTSLSVKFCFLVDGLDEYTGDHKKLAMFIKEMAEYTNVKVCASSRPLLVFERELQCSPGLILQNLTSRDIKSFVRRHFDSQDRMAVLEEQEPGLKTALSSEIASKASGVFLWVTLVMGSLIEGLENFDDPADLRRRLEDLPDRLEDLYWHMIKRVKPQWYLEEGFRLLLLTKAGGGSIQLLLLCFAEIQGDDIPSRQKQEYMCKALLGRIKSRCLGLLEVDMGDTADPNFEDWKARFLHKSVMDFLETENAIIAAGKYTGATDFVPETRLMSAILRLLKASSDERGLRRSYFFDTILGLVNDFMELARREETTTKRDSLNIIDELDSVVSELWNEVTFRSVGEMNGTIHWSRVKPDIERSQGTFTKRTYRSQESPSHALFDQTAFVQYTYQKGLRIYPAAKRYAVQPSSGHIKSSMDFPLPVPDLPGTNSSRLQAAEEITGVNSSMAADYFRPTVLKDPPSWSDDLSELSLSDSYYSAEDEPWNPVDSLNWV